MTDQQFTEFLGVFREMLKEILDRQFVISQAADWPILLIMMGVVAGLGVFIWKDLKATIKSKFIDLEKTISTVKIENDREHDIFKAQIKELQTETRKYLTCKKR